MAIIIETGVKETGANSFVTEAELTTYLTDRGYTLTGVAANLLVLSFDLIQALNLKVDLNYAFYLEGFEWDLLKKGQCEIAYRIGAGLDPSATVERTVKSQKLEGLARVFADGGAGLSSNPLGALKRMPAAYGYLERLIVPPYMGRA